MEIKELRKLKLKLELDILKLLKQFKSKTGITPHDFDVKTESIYQIGRSKPEIILERVSLRIEI